MTYGASSAAVFCAANGCDHLDCPGGPFHIVLVGTDNDRDKLWASVYSSETGAWSTPTSIHSGRAGYVDTWRGAVVGDESYFILSRSPMIVKYDWSKNCLSLIEPPPPGPEVYCYSVSLMEMEDNSLGLAAIEDSILHIWSRKVNTEGVAEWVKCADGGLRRNWPSRAAPRLRRPEARSVGRPW